jgi:hypothetical protein
LGAAARASCWLLLLLLLLLLLPPAGFIACPAAEPLLLGLL